MIRPKHPQAGKLVTLQVAGLAGKYGHMAGRHYLIQDWWINVAGRSWTNCHSPACLDYSIRSGVCHLPIDDEVVYGKIGNIGYIVHATEIGDVVPEPHNTPITQQHEKDTPNS